MGKISEFFRSEYGRMVRFVRRMIDDTAERDAEDIVQDVMLSVFSQADVTLPIENLTAYVYQSLRNKVVDLLRRRKNVLTLSEMIEDMPDETLRRVEQKELIDFVNQAIDALSDEQKAVILATEFEGFSFRELSEMWETPIGTLLARKSRALKEMRKKLTRLVNLNYS